MNVEERLAALEARVAALEAKFGSVVVESAADLGGPGSDAGFDTHLPQGGPAVNS